MEINWFEIIAQMVNFFILLFLLHKLFYTPIIDAMEKRQESVAMIQQEADKKLQGANDKAKIYEEKLAALENKKRDLTEQAKDEATKTKEELIKRYKNEAQEKRDDFRQEIEEEKERFLRELRKILGKESVKIAAGILRILSQKELEQEIFTAFLQKLSSLGAEALQDESVGREKILLRSARNLSDKQKATAEKMLADLLGEGKEISYEIDEDLILGYELKLETMTVQANVKKLLVETEKNIEKELENLKE